MDGVRDGSHTYMLEWTEEEYVFFVDNTEIWRTTAGGVSKVPAYVKITGELSTESWAINEQWSNDPESAEYPDYFVVDYVRIYQDKSFQQSIVLVMWNCPECQQKFITDASNLEFR